MLAPVLIPPIAGRAGTPHRRVGWGSSAGSLEREVEALLPLCPKINEPCDARSQQSSAGKGRGEEDGVQGETNGIPPPIARDDGDLLRYGCPRGEFVEDYPVV